MTAALIQQGGIICHAVQLISLHEGDRHGQENNCILIS
jgi:hypothetical protein